MYNIKEFKKGIPYPFLKTFPINTKDSWQDSIQLLLDGPLDSSEKGPIGIIAIGKLIEDENLKIFSDTLRKLLNNRELIVSSNIITTRNCIKTILLVSPGTCTRNELQSIKEELNIIKSPIVGWAVLDPGFNI